MSAVVFVAESLRIAAPYAFAAVAGVWAERSGVVQIGLEGVLLVGAFTSVAVAHATGSAVLGLLAGVGAGVLVSLLHGAIVIAGKVDAVLSGIALNLLAYAGTRMLLRAFYDSSSNSPSIPGFAVGPVGADGGATLLRVLVDPVTVLGVAAVAATPFVLARTRLGLHVRAVGDGPVEARAAGLDVGATRAIALAISGVLGGLGGVHLAFDQHRFEAGMSAGRGFIALAAVVVSGWRAGRAAAACLAFGVLESIQIALQHRGRTNALTDLVPLLPYVATLAVLAVASSKPRAPRGLGR